LGVGNKLKKSQMKNKILVLILTLISIIGYGQQQNENILYVVDSIPVIEDPKEGFGTLNENEIDRLEVIEDEKMIELTGYKNIDKIIYIFTKSYVDRPDSIKSIPTTNLMVKENGTWYFKGATNPYTGPFIDYYLNGNKQGEGFLYNGRLKGKRLKYYLNGNVSDDTEYENGIANGIEKLFYEDGTLKQKGILKKGKEIGVWEVYHPNGQLKQQSTFNVNGKMDGEAITYYSTGKIKRKNTFVNGVYQKDKVNDKLIDYYNDSQELYKQANYKGAIKKLNKALELDSTWADGYFSRGTMKLNDFQFDEAIKDFDKTLEIEPYFTNAYANRAFAVIRKYEFGDYRTLSNSKYTHVIASKEIQIPKEDLNKICEDLNKAVYLGDDSWMVLEAIEKHCKK